MDLNHEFTVHRPIDEAWVILTDLERIAPCLPGAQLDEVEGDVHRGQVKVKVGPILATFKGQAHFVERNPDGHKAVLQAAGRDTSGKGNAEALITAQLEPLSPTVTTCKVATHLSITGKVAQFGRGALADISDKLLTQFSNNLNDLIEQPDQSAPPDQSEVPGQSEPPAQSAGPAQAAAPQEPARTVRAIEGPAAEPLDLGSVATGPILKRLLPLFAGIVVLLVLLRRRRH
ncbi:MAG: SRPBCC family protein [Actinomycetota bacterium]|nr:MAG: SRPBCC family protein [Actinomycetota bacterium]